MPLNNTRAERQELEDYKKGTPSQEGNPVIIYHMKKPYYTIDYWFDEEDSELHLMIYQGTKTVYTEDIVGDFEDEEDRKLTCLEVAQSHGFFPALFQEDHMKKAMSELGKRSFAKRSKDKKKMSEWGKKAAAARWKKHKNKSV